jgi:tRNA pseudouridine32 synthase/23S rRNA pseudouridine746 synthase/23S rRNA pseudouridine1911/1915/1917 synthase
MIRRERYFIQNKKPFKRPPKKYQPRGLTILYEDWDIIVVNKTDGLLTIKTGMGQENTAHHFLNEYVRKGNSKSKNRVFIVHRLDRDTSGILVFAKSEQAKRFLQDQWQEFQKKYYAVIRGSMAEKTGLMSSYLVENSAHKMYSVSDPGKGKLAKTEYRVLKESTTYSLLEINLLTGRKNQIRVHCADNGCPVVGDKKYGVKEPGIKRLCLHAASIAFIHPFTKEPMTFETKVPAYFETLLKKS